MGLKFDGSSKSVSVEDFVFVAEALRVDNNCPWDIFVKGFHHLLTGRAHDWIWEFRQQTPICQWDHLNYHFVKEFRSFVQIVKDNLKESLVQLVYPKNIETINELIEECKRAERNISKRVTYRQQQHHSYRRVNELYDEELTPTDVQNNVDALTAAPGRQLVCWNCKKTWTFLH